MTNYIPHYTKKIRILSRRREALRRLIRADASSQKLVRCAEQVREAQIRVIRARRAMIAPKDDAKEYFNKMDDMIRQIQQTPTNAILKEHGYNADLRHTHE